MGIFDDLFGGSKSKEDRAFEAEGKGRRDWSRNRGLGDDNPITEAFHPSYDPPAGNKADYDRGRARAKWESKRRR